MELLRLELDWAEREREVIVAGRDHEQELRRHFDEMLASVESFEVSIPSSPQIQRYVDDLFLIARQSNVSLRNSVAEIVQHDRYQEVVLDLSVEGTRESTELFRSRAYGNIRLAAWSEPKVRDSAMKVRVSIFAVPPMQPSELRRCRPIDTKSITSDDQEVEPLEERTRLESACKELARWDELNEAEVQPPVRDTPIEANRRAP